MSEVYELDLFWWPKKIHIDIQTGNQIPNYHDKVKCVMLLPPGTIYRLVIIFLNSSLIHNYYPHPLTLKY
jgi:hypothetical protein